MDKFQIDTDIKMTVLIFLYYDEIQIGSIQVFA